MVVAINGSWKLPIGYFFIAHLNANVKSQLTTTAIQKLYDVNVRVVSLTFFTNSPGKKNVIRYTMKQGL